ncbi:MAG: glycosyltransferase family 39 protein [Actinobacteria bacterium]|nr:glycosyltransferase family 39 protein [Actinomycetota bacterium]
MTDPSAEPEPIAPWLPERTVWWPVLAALAVAVALRLWIGFAQPLDDLRGDSITFAHTATSGWDGLSAYYPLLPQLYYMVVAAVTGVSGGTLTVLDPDAGRVLAVAGTLPSVVAVVLLERLGRRLGGVRAGTVSAWLAAVSPMMVFASPRIMTEAVVVPVAVATLLAWYHLLAEPSWRRVGWLAFAATLLVFSRAEGLGVVVIIAAHLAWRAWRDRTDAPIGPSFARLGAVALVPLVLFAGWSVWSTRLDQGGVDEVGMTSFGVTALAGNCPSAYRDGPLIGWKSYPCIGFGGPDDPEVIRWQESRKPRPLILEYVREAGPARVLGVSTIKVLRANGLFAPDLTVDLQEQDARWPDGIFRWTLWWWWFLLATAIGGFALIRRAGSSLVPLLAPIVVANAAIFLTWGNPRYRAMSEPSLIVAAACLLAALSTEIGRRAGHQPSSSPSSGTSRSQRSRQSSQR